MKEMKSVEDWHECLEASRREPVLVFKHSTRCSISSLADTIVRRYEAGDGAGKPPLYVVKVVEFRAVSDEIARDLDVKHKSPQLILLKDCQALWSTSHYNITLENIQEAMDRFHQSPP